MDCPQCGTSLRNDSRFCPQCGSRVKTISQARVAEPVAASAIEVERRPGARVPADGPQAASAVPDSNAAGSISNGSTHAAAGLLPAVILPKTPAARQAPNRTSRFHALSTRRAAFGGALLVLLLGGFLLLHRSGGGTKVRRPAVHYALRLGATVPARQRVGDNVLLTVGVNNSGRSVPNLVLRFNGLSSWVVNGMSDTCGTGSAQELTVPNAREWALGPIGKRTSCQVDLTLVATTAGRQTLRVTPLANVDAQGAGDARTAIHHGGFTRVVVIQPARRGKR